MNRTLLSVILLAIFALLQAIPSFGQDRSAPVASERGEIHAEGKADYTWVGDGGEHLIHLLGDVRFEGAPVEGKPYSAESVTEIVQTLADGNRIRSENRVKIYRDSKGRTRREESLGKLGPWSTGGEDLRIFINDPVSNTHWVLNPKDKTARKMETPMLHQEPGGTAVAVKMIVGERVGGTAAGEHVAVDAIHQEEHEARVAAAGRFVRRIAITAPVPGTASQGESLGKRMIEGVEADGTRYTSVIPAGQIGNEREIQVVFERWHSAELGVDVLTKRSDPRSGEMTYSLKNIQRTDPLPTLFEPPADYEVVEGNVLFQYPRQRR